MDTIKSKNADEKTESQLVTERIHFLRENTDFTLTLFQNLVGYAIIAADFDGNIIAFNRGAELIYGCTAEEVVGKERFDGFLPCNFIESWEAQGTAELLREKRFSCEIEMSRKNGEVFPAHLLFTLTKDSGGKTIGFVLIVHDLTERMLAEQAKALQQIVVSYKTLVETSPDVLMLLDANMIIVLCSSIPGIELFGYADNPKEIIGKNFFEFITPVQQQQHLKDEIAHIKKVGVIRSAEYQFVRKDGTIFFGEISISIFINPKGNPESYIVVVRDITRRKKIEQSHARLVSIIESTSDLVGFADAKDMHLIYINKEGRKMCGIGEDENIAQFKIADFLPEWTNKLMKDTIIPTAIRDGQWKGECALLNRDGREIPVSAVIIAHKTSTGEVEVFSTISRDVTERKRAEESLRQSYDRLKRTVEETAVALSSALELRDAYTAGHQRRVAKLACAIAREIGVSENQIEGIRVAGTLHDIGKISIPADILSKPCKLSNLEYEMIKTHAQVGYELLKNIEFPWPVAQIVLQHHERMDGSGYPSGLSGDKTMIEARVLCVSDVVESMATHRPYREALGIDTALEEITKKRGVLYDDNAVDACVMLFKEKGFTFA